MQGSNLSEAKKRWATYLQQARNSPRDHDQAVVNLVAMCRKKARCHQEECPVCDYLRQKAERRILRASATKLIVGSMLVKVLIDEVHVIGKRRELNRGKVRLIAASMSEIGQESPIIVRMVKKKVVLVAGHHRLAAAKALGWEQILCSWMNGDATDARLYQISENLHRADLRVLDRAECIEEWRTLIKQKNREGQLAPPGGHQKTDVAINKTAKKLGFTREEIRRAKAIAGIHNIAKSRAREVKLDNNQHVLLEIAKLRTPQLQLEVLAAMVERKRSNRFVHLSIAKQKALSEIGVVEASIAKGEGALVKVSEKLSDQRKHLVSLKEIAAGNDETFGVPLGSVYPGQEKEPMPDNDQVADDAGSDDPVGDISPVPAQLDEQDEQLLRKLGALWERASMAVRQQFLHSVQSTLH